MEQLSALLLAQLPVHLHDLQHKDRGTSSENVQLIKALSHLAQQLAFPNCQLKLPHSSTSNKNHAPTLVLHTADSRIAPVCVIVPTDAL